MATLLALLACRLIATVSSSPPFQQGEAEFNASWYQLVGQPVLFPFPSMQIQSTERWHQKPHKSASREFCLDQQPYFALKAKCLDFFPLHSHVPLLQNMQYSSHVVSTQDLITTTKKNIFA